MLLTIARDYDEHQKPLAQKEVQYAKYFLKLILSRQKTQIIMQQLKGNRQQQQESLES